MSALICGSLAFDTIITFPGRFAEQILPEQLHILNVSFLVPTLRREFGGCAGNIAYSLRQLGGEPVRDGRGGRRRRRVPRAAARPGASSTELVRAIDEAATRRRPSSSPTATTTRSPRSIPARCSPRTRPGAGARATSLGHHRARRPRRDAAARRAARRGRHSVHLRSGPGPADVRRRRAARVHRAGHLGGRQRLRGRMLCERTGRTLESISRSHAARGGRHAGRAGLRRLGARAATHIPGVAAREVVDPTGCGDAFRAALLYGLERDWPLQRCAALGNRVGAIKIASAAGRIMCSIARNSASPEIQRAQVPTPSDRQSAVMDLTQWLAFGFSGCSRRRELSRPGRLPVAAGMAARSKAAEPPTARRARRPATSRRSRRLQAKRQMEALQEGSGSPERSRWRRPRAASSATVISRKRSRQARRRT